MHSILVRAPLAQAPASVRCGMEAISMWHCLGNIEPSAHLDCWNRLHLIFLLKISHGFQMGVRSGMFACLHVCWLIKHSNIMVSKPLGTVLALWTGAKVLLEKEISISIKLLSRWKHKVQTLCLIKHNRPTPADVTSRHPKSSLTSETSHWPLQSSSRLQTLIS